MIPVIVRLRGDLSELQGKVADLEAKVELLHEHDLTLVAQLELQHAHIENLIERLLDLETWMARHNPGYNRHINSDCTCGYGGQHEPANPRCLRNQRREMREGGETTAADTPVSQPEPPNPAGW